MTTQMFTKYLDNRRISRLDYQPLFGKGARR